MDRGKSEPTVADRTHTVEYGEPKTPSHISHCRTRLTDFENALCAFASIVDNADEVEARSKSTSLRDRLDRLDEHLHATQQWLPEQDPCEIREARAELQELDREIDDLSVRLCDTVSSVPAESLHSVFCPAEPDLQRGIEMLVDVVLERDPDLRKHRIVFEFLVTVLSTAEQDGARRVVRDPTTLTRRLRARSDQVASESQVDFSIVEETFLEATRAATQTGVGQPRDGLEALKRELGSAVLAPRALRAVVFFNAASWRVDRIGGQRAAASPRALTTTMTMTSIDGSTVPELSQRIGADSRSRPEGLADATPRDASEVRWRIDPRPPEADPLDDIERSVAIRQTFRHSIAIATCIAMSIALITLGWSHTNKGTVKVLSEIDLRAVSTRLESGYRSGLGSGPLFIGRLDGSWRGLSSQEKAESANEIVSRLRESGLREILLYDQDLRIVLHHAPELPPRIGA